MPSPTKHKPAMVGTLVPAYLKQAIIIAARRERVSQATIFRWAIEDWLVRAEYLRPDHALPEELPEDDGNVVYGRCTPKDAAKPFEPYQDEVEVHQSEEEREAGGAGPAAEPEI